MKQPADGWDRDEREALDELQDELDALSVRHRDQPSALDALRAARHDALPADWQAAAAQRLSQDAWSRTLIEGLDAAEPALDRQGEDRILARVRKGSRPARSAVALAPFRFAWAGTAAAATLAIVWLLWPVTLTSPTLPTEQARVETPPRQSFELPLDKPDVMLSMAALTWRGSAENPLVADLKSPLDAYRAGDYARADREFAGLEARYPQAVEVFFYGGVSRLFLNEPQRAIAALARAEPLADSTFAWRVLWYRAVAEQRLGNLSAARSRLDTLCRGTTERAAEACEAIKRLDSATGTPDAR